jgi:DNA helicase-2/ATP-dependent DNA helicase PcrA
MRSAQKMLRRHAELVGLQSNFTIIDTDDQLRLLKQLIQAKTLTRSAGRAPAWWADRPLEEPGPEPADLDAAENERYANGRARSSTRVTRTG